MPDELTKALLLEEVAAPAALADALYVSVTSNVPLVHALVDTGAVKPELLVRYLGRAEAPFLRHVVPIPDLVDRLPPGMCERLLAIPVRRDAITGTVDVVVADASDPHPAREMAFHLGVPVRVVRAPLSAIEDALRRLLPRANVRSDDENLFDSRPRASTPRSSLALSAASRLADLPPATSRDPGMFQDRRSFQPPPGSLRPAPLPEVRTTHTVPSVAPPARPRMNTPTWGTPVHAVRDPSEPPKPGSEIPIPLTRKTYTAVAGGTQRPPPLLKPEDAGLGDGYPVDPASLRAIVEVRTDTYEAAPHSLIPGPPPAFGSFAAYAPQLPFPDLGQILAALKGAGSRDEILELLLTGARSMAFKVALFVVKRAGYLGWTCTPEFGDRAALQQVLVSHEIASVFDRSIHEGLYLGPIRHDAAHAGLLAVMRSPSRDVAVVPVLVTGKPAVIVVADELGDTMLATQRLEELAVAAGEALARIVRQKR